MEQKKTAIWATDKTAAVLDDKELEDQIPLCTLFCVNLHNATYASDSAKFSKMLGIFKPGMLWDITVSVCIVPHHAAVLALVSTAADSDGYFSCLFCISIDFIIPELNHDKLREKPLNIK